MRDQNNFKRFGTIRGVGSMKKFATLRGAGSFEDDLINHHKLQITHAITIRGSRS